MLLFISFLRCTEFSFYSKEENNESILGFTHEDIDNVLENNEENIETILGIIENKIGEDELIHLMSADGTQNERNDERINKNNKCMSIKNIQNNNFTQDEMLCAKNFKINHDIAMPYVSDESIIRINTNSPENDQIVYGEGGSTIINENILQKSMFQEKDNHICCNMVRYNASKDYKPFGETFEEEDLNDSYREIGYNKMQGQSLIKDLTCQEEKELELVKNMNDSAHMFLPHKEERFQENQHTMYEAIIGIGNFRDLIHEQIHKESLQSNTYTPSMYIVNNCSIDEKTNQQTNLCTKYDQNMSSDINKDVTHEVTSKDGNYSTINDTSSTSISQSSQRFITPPIINIQYENYNNIIVCQIDGALLLEKRLRELKVKFDTFKFKARQFISKIPSNKKNKNLNNKEKKIVELYRNYLNRRFGFYKRSLVIHAESIINKITTGFHENSLIIDSLNFVISVCDFAIPPSRKLRIREDTLKLFYYFSLDFWKLDQMLDKLDLGNFIELIIYHFNNKNIQIIQAKYDLEALFYNFDNFSKQKEILSIRIKNICEIIGSKYNYKI
ncbi:uncharacterized protein VNE69_02248 [Vairimorpha necatrix]|uniref:Uncharacterized protein n=1 Tax=Vairimorpha necatrix TaxID=6039 RepID=A0AAX4J9P7_9MICR